MSAAVLMIVTALQIAYAAAVSAAEAEVTLVVSEGMTTSTEIEVFGKDGKSFGKPAEGEPVACEDPAYYSISCTDEKIMSSGLYAVYVTKDVPEDGSVPEIDSSNTIFMDQKTASEDGKVSFGKVYPTELADSVIVMSGTNIKPEIIAAVSKKEADPTDPEAEYGAKTDGRLFKTLADAVAKVSDGDTIIMLKASEEGITVPEKELSFTVDPGEYGPVPVVNAPEGYTVEPEPSSLSEADRRKPVKYTVTEEKESIYGAVIGDDAFYDTLEDAVAHVKDGQTITMLKESTSSVTAQKAAMKFTIDPGEFGPIPVIKAPQGYSINPVSPAERLRMDDIKYTVTRNTTNTVTGGGGGGGGGSSSTSANATYTLTFNTNGGTAVGSITRVSNTTISLANYNTAREGYTFEGWCSDSSLSNVVASVTLTRNTVVYAKWKENRENGSSGNDNNGSGGDGSGADTSSYAGFRDVEPGAYYAGAVDWAVKKGITTGTSSDTFSPDDVCTRAQMVTFLWRAAGSPEPESVNNIFTDADVNSYYGKAVLWAVENNITNGMSPGKFNPDDTVNRGQTVTFIYRAAGSPDARASSDFRDVVPGAYYNDAVNWAVAKGITNGISRTEFDPEGDCTRAQIVTMLNRYYIS